MKTDPSPRIATIGFPPDHVRLLELQCENLGVQCRIQSFDTTPHAIQEWTSGQDLPDVVVLNAILPIFSIFTSIGEVRKLPGARTLPICVAGAFERDRDQIEKSGACYCPGVDESPLTVILEVVKKRP